MARVRVSKRKLQQVARAQAKTAADRQTRARTFPREIYVTWDTTMPSASVLLAERDHAGAEDGALVAIYTLQTVQIKRVVHALEEQE